MPIRYMLLLASPKSSRPHGAVLAANISEWQAWRYVPLATTTELAINFAPFL